MNPVYLKEPKRFLPLPEGVAVGDMVSYYLNGWRVGLLSEISGNDAGIKPVGTYHHVGERPRLKWVNISDLKAVEK